MLAALVGLGAEVDVTFVFDFGRARVLFAENFSGLESCFDGNFVVGFQIVRQEELPKASVATH